MGGTEQPGATLNRKWSDNGGCSSSGSSDDGEEGMVVTSTTAVGPASLRATKGGMGTRTTSSRASEKVAGKGVITVDGNLQRTAIRFRSQLLCRLKPIAFVWMVLTLGIASIVLPFSSFFLKAHKTGDSAATVLEGRQGPAKHLLLPFGWSFRPRSNGNRPMPSQPLPSPPRARCEPPDESTGRQFFLLGKPFELAELNSTGLERERGVVIAASGLERLAVGAYVTSYLIRRVLGSSLPIEIYYVGDKEALPATAVEKLKELGDVRVVDLVKALDDRYGDYYREHAASSPASSGKFSYLAPTAEQLRSYSAKPYAVLASSFRENVLFDAGAVPFQLPDTFFDMQSYKSSGFSIFRDYVPSSKSRWDWVEKEMCVDVDEIVKYFDGTEGDSSCVLIDKKKNWDALVVTTILNGPFQSITYKRLNGDKDTWVMGMMYTKHHLEPLATTPGFLFIDYLGDGWARKVHGQLQLLKVGGGEGGGHSEPGEQAGLVPLYYNNQLFNFTDWEYNKEWTYVGSYEDFGSLYSPPDSLSPDCYPYDANNLDRLSPPMIRAFDGVLEALSELGSTHCACRDDWPSQCVWWIWR